MRQLNAPSFSLVVIAVLCFGSTMKANAQSNFRLGLSLGANIGSVRYTPEPYHNGTLTTNYRAGLAAGLISQWGLGQHLALQTGLRYLRTGFATDETSSSTTSGISSHSHYQNSYALNKIEIPVNLLYFINHTAQGPYALLGASASALLSGKRTYESNFTTDGASSTITGTDDIGVASIYPLGTSQYYMRRWDVGIQAGAGYQKGRIGIQASYRLGVLNTEASSGFNLPSPTIHSRLAEVQACYYFL